MRRILTFRLLPLGMIASVLWSFLVGTVGLNCGSRNAESMQAPSSDIERLAKRINLSETPETALYTVVPVGRGDGVFGPTDYRLVAVLRFDSESLARMKERATRLNAEAHSIWLPERPDWFPVSIRTAIRRCANDWCIDGEEYSGAGFLKGGFVSGSFIIPDNQEFLILLLRT